MDGLCPPQPLLACHHVQRTLVPPECLRVVVVAHTRLWEGSWCLAVEVSDPHTQEMLALVVDPARRPTTTPGVVEAVLNEVRTALLEVLDPEPFE